MYRDIRVLDIHGHMSSPGGNGALAVGLMLASNTPIQWDPLRNELPRLNMTNEEWDQAVKFHTDLLDDHEIDVQLIGPRPFLTLGWMGKHLFPSWVRFVNHCIAKQVSIRPDRFVGAAMLPQDPDAQDLSNCIDELRYTVEELGFRGVYLSPDPSGDRGSPGMNTSYWDPVYAYCQEHDLPIIVHGTNCTDPRLAIIPQNYQIGSVWEQYLATQLLMHGDVFERFPELRILVCHCGGALDRFIKSDYHLGQKDRSKNLFFDTTALDLDFLEAAIKQRTPKQTAFGTETPGSGGSKRPETGRQSDDLVPYVSAMTFLSEDEKRLIFETNPMTICPTLGQRTGKATGIKLP